AAVTAALRRLEGRARLKIAAAVLGITAVVGGGTALVVKKLAHRPRDVAQSQPVPAAPPQPVTATAPAARIAPPAVAAQRPVAADPGAGASTASTVVPKRAAAGPRRATRQPPALFAAPAPAEPVPTRTFALAPTPQNVDVYLDGRRMFGYDV